MEIMEFDQEQKGEALLKIKKFVRLNTANLATVLVCAIFFCSAFLRPEWRSDITLLEIFMNSFLAFVVSMTLNNLFNGRAIKDGLADKEVIKAADDHNKSIDRITEENAIEELDVWCKDQNRKNYRNQRARILSKVGLSYMQCFTEDGVVKQVEIVRPRMREMGRLGLRMWLLRRAICRRQTKAFKKATRLRLTELSAGELTGEGGSRNDPFNLGRGIHEYKKQIATTNTVSKIVFAIAIGYLASDMVAEFSWLKLMINTFQIVWFLAMGSIQYINTNSFITGEYKGRLIKKGRYLVKFLKEREERRKNESEREVPCQLGGGDHVAAAPSERNGQLHAPAG